MYRGGSSQSSAANSLISQHHLESTYTLTGEFLNLANLLDKLIKLWMIPPSMQPRLEAGKYL
jgi:hypothetical protein